MPFAELVHPEDVSRAAPRRRAARPRASPARHADGDVARRRDEQDRPARRPRVGGIVLDDPRRPRAQGLRAQLHHRPSTTRSPACPTARCSRTASAGRRAPRRSEAGRRPVRRPRRLQDHQRLARPRRRRRAPAPDRGAPGRVPARPRHRRPPRRRRVRDPRRGPRRREPGDRRRRARARGARQRPSPSTSEEVFVRASIGIAERRRRGQLDERAHAQRRHGDVHGEGARQGPPPDLRARRCTSRARRPGCS